MNFEKLMLISVILLMSTQTAYAAENEYGIVNASFNDKNATVEGFSMKIGEPAEVKINIISKIDGDVTLTLYEPGVTRAFKIINGPGDIDKWIDTFNINAGWSKTYTWTVAPNGAWKNGNAPLNVIVQFNKGMKNKQIDFTIVNPYILDEQYSGSTPAQTTGALQPSPTGTSPTQQQAPFLSALVAIAVIIGVWMIHKKTNRK